MVLLKKSQIEAMGLVIIIAILSFVLIFALQFINKEKDNKLNERYMQLNADNLRSVILKTTINKCNIKDEIVNCNSGNSLCFENCDKLKEIIKEIIENSVKNNYEFNAGNINLVKGNCLNENIQTSSIEPIAQTEIKIDLKLC